MSVREIDEAKRSVTSAVFWISTPLLATLDPSNGKDGNRDRETGYRLVEFTISFDPVFVPPAGAINMPGRSWCCSKCSITN